MPLLLLCVPVLTLAQQNDRSAPAKSSLQWLHDLLSEHSAVTLPGAGGRRDRVTTRTTGPDKAGRIQLAYERTTYAPDGGNAIESRQIILYALSPAALDPDGVEVRSGGESASGEFWLVIAGVRKDPGFVDYDNLFESRGEDGAPELTRSRGRVREVALGYFSDEAVAADLANRVRRYLTEARPAAPPKPITNPSQSGA